MVNNQEDKNTTRLNPSSVIVPDKIAWTDGPVPRSEAPASTTERCTITPRIVVPCASLQDIEVIEIRVRIKGRWHEWLKSR